jgi:MoaA/NifB/PqqE/SkfB family radical SAM enzyme
MSSILKFKKLLQLIRRPRAFFNFKKYLLFAPLKLIFLPYYPSWIELEVSTKCNLNCPRCERQIADKNILENVTPIEVINKISPIFPYIRFVSLVSGLGEPFLNPNLWKIVSIIKNYGVSIGYTTNGLLLNKENIKKTLDEKVDIVVVSIESLKKDVYEGIRPGSNLDMVINNLKNLIKHKNERKLKSPEIRIGFTIQKSTINELPEIVKFAHKLGIKVVYFTNLISHTKNLINESPYFIDKDYVKKIFDNTKKTASKLKIKIRLPNINTKKKNDCYYSKNTLFIDYSGQIFCNSCCRSSQKQYFGIEDEKITQKESKAPVNLLGNINNESILKIWNNKNYKELRKNLKKDNPDSPCNTC